MAIVFMEPTTLFSIFGIWWWFHSRWLLHLVFSLHYYQHFDIWDNEWGEVLLKAVRIILVVTFPFLVPIIFLSLIFSSVIIISFYLFSFLCPFLSKAQSCCLLTLNESSNWIYFFAFFMISPIDFESNFSSESKNPLCHTSFFIIVMTIYICKS